MYININVCLSVKMFEGGGAEKPGGGQKEREGGREREEGRKREGQGEAREERSG